MKDRRNLKNWYKEIKEHCKPYWEKENPELFKYFPLTKERRKNEK